MRLEIQRLDNYPGSWQPSSYADASCDAKANIDEAFATARKHGAEGVMLCDWGDGGFAQPLEESRPMMDYAAKLYRQAK